MDYYWRYDSRLGNKEGCISYFPDPWSSDEKAYPKELNNLLELPRYVSELFVIKLYPINKKVFKDIKVFLKKKKSQFI